MRVAAISSSNTGSMIQATSQTPWRRWGPRSHSHTSAAIQASGKRISQGDGYSRPLSRTGTNHVSRRAGAASEVAPSYPLWARYQAWTNQGSSRMPRMSHVLSAAITTRRGRRATSR